MRRNLGPAYSLPVTVWMATLFVVPIAIIIAYSFMSKGLYGGVVPRFSLNAYAALFNSTFMQVTFNTLLIAVVSTILMVSLALPASYCIARSRYKNVLLMLVIIPFWTDFIIRIYSWIGGTRQQRNCKFFTCRLGRSGCARATALQ